MEEELQKKTKELEALQQEFDDFMESSKDLEAELEKSLQDSNTKLADMEKKKIDAETKSRNLQDSVNQLSKENRQLQTQVSTMKDKMTALEEGKRKLENENEELSNQVRILQATEEDLQHKLLNADEDIVYLKADIEELKSENQSLQQKMEEELARMQAAINAMTPTSPMKSPKPDFGIHHETLHLEETTQENLHQARMIEDLENSVKNLMEQIDILEAENNTLIEQVKDLQSSATANKDTISMPHIDEMMQAYKQDIRTKEEEIESLQNTIAHQKQALREQEESLLNHEQTSTQQIQHLHTELQTLQAELEKVQEDKKTLERAMGNSQKMLEEVHEQAVSELKLQLKTKTEELMKVSEVNNELENKHNEQLLEMTKKYQSKIDKLTEELASQQKTSERSTQDESERLHEMEELLKARNNEIAQLKGIIKENEDLYQLEKMTLTTEWNEKLTDAERKWKDALEKASKAEVAANLDVLRSKEEVLERLIAKNQESENEIEQLKQSLLTQEQTYKHQNANTMKEMSHKIDHLMAELAKHKESQQVSASQTPSHAGSDRDRSSSGGSSILSFKDVYGLNLSHGRFDSTTSLMKRIQTLLMSSDLDKLKRELVTVVEMCEALKNNNVKLLNKIQAVRGNIVVCCRTRPPNESELSQHGKVIVDASDDTELLCYDYRSDSWKSFVFDRVWKSDANQADVFSDVEPLVLSVTDGYNACIMAYGQTGSGKTYTMDGYGEQYGVNYRTIQKIFDLLEEKKAQVFLKAKSNPNGSPGRGKQGLGTKTGNGRLSTAIDISDHDGAKVASSKAVIPIGKRSSYFEYSNPLLKATTSVSATSTSAGVAAAKFDDAPEVTPFEIDDIEPALNDSTIDDVPFKYWVEISMLEIYNEQVYDLLNDGVGGGQTDGVSLDIRQAPDNTVSVPGLKQVQVRNIEEVMTVFSKGSANRATASTNMNEHSSRSHLIIQVDVTIEQDQESQIKGKLFLVDLAGSERIDKSGATGATMKEAQYINKSLLALGDVMEALDQKQKHIPYRNSKLTFLLQNALGGNARTMMIVTICPTDLTFEESSFTLHFATRVRNITLGAAQRNSNSKNLEICVKNLKHELKEMKRKKLQLEETIAELKKEQKRTQEKTTGPLESKIKSLEEMKRGAEIVTQQLQRQLQEMTTRAHEEKEHKERVRAELEVTQRNLKKALEQAKDNFVEHERVAALIKNKDQEITSLKTALTKASTEKKTTPKKEESKSSVNDKFHPRHESEETSTPYHITKKSRNDEEDLHDVMSLSSISIDNQATMNNKHANSVAAVMGPPSTPISMDSIVASSTSKPARASHVPTSSSRLSPSSSATKVRVSLDTAFPKSALPIPQQRSSSRSRLSSFGSASSASAATVTSGSSIQKKAASLAIRTPTTATSSSNPATPATPNSRLQADGATTPEKTNKIMPATTFTSINTAPQPASRIPSLSARSEEALRRHQLRMEKKRAEQPKK